MVEKGVTGINEIKADACYLGDLVTVIYKKLLQRLFESFRMQRETRFWGKAVKN